MAGILKGKKSQFVDFAIVLIIIISLTAIMSNKVTERNNYIQIGAKQFTIFSAYAEGEKVQEYLKLAGEFSLSEIVGSCEKAQSLTESTIAFRVGEKMKTYIANYNSTNPKFNVTFPDYYLYTVSNQAYTNLQISLTGIASDKIIIKSGTYKFTYSIKGDFKSAVSCDKFEQLKPGSEQTQFMG